MAGLAGAIAAMLQVRWLPALGMGLGIAWLQPGQLLDSYRCCCSLGGRLHHWNMAGRKGSPWSGAGFYRDLGRASDLSGLYSGNNQRSNIGPMDPTFQGFGQAYLPMLPA